MRVRAASSRDAFASSRHDAASSDRPRRGPGYNRPMTFIPHDRSATSGRLVKQSVTSWSDDYAPSMGAALAYYTVFSIAPLLLIVISIAGLIYGEDAARGAIFQQISGLVGAEGAAAVQGLLKSVNKPSESIVATIVGIGDAAARRDDGVRRTAGRAEPHLARAGAEGVGRPVEPAAAPPARVRHDPHDRLPDDRVAACCQRGARRDRQLARPALHRLGGRCCTSSTSSSASA